MKDILKKMAIEMIEDGSSEIFPDIARCMECGWKGKISKCVREQEGDYESGYYDVDMCPKCKDGGEIDYDMSRKQLKKWEKKNKIEGME